MDLQGVFVKIRDFIKCKGFLVEFLENRRSWENQKPPANRQKSGLFWASPLTMHLVCTLLIFVKMALLSLAKGFCRAKFWAKFPFWRGGAVRGEVFREVCREVFHEVFGLVLLGHSEKNFSKNFSPKFPWHCTAKLEKFQGKTSRRGSAGGPSPTLLAVQKHYRRAHQDYSHS